MTKLDCTVKTCTHNENKCCCLGEIEVSGKGALNSDMTCCSSFCEKSANSAQNIAEKYPDKATGIKCDVENCTYNQHHYCTADSVDITGSNACTCGQTECSTFKQR